MRSTTVMPLVAAECPPAGTTVYVDGTMSVGGLIAQVGQRLVGATARMMMDRFFKCLQSKT